MTVVALSNALKSILSRSGVDNPDGDAAEIIQSTLGFTRVDLLTRGETEVSPECEEKAIQLARRRADGEPIQYVLGSWSFMGRDYLVGEGVLIPRDDTEVVTAAALELLRDIASPKVVDLCAGSGIIGITIKKERPDAAVTAVEKGAEAFAYLRRNCENNHAELHLIQADLAECADEIPDGSLNMIVSNPPYIPSREIAGLQSEIQYEPRLALDGGEDGCDFYRMILAVWTKKLKKSGCIAFEIGEEQFDTIAGLLQQVGFTDIKGHLDIQGIIRAVTAVYISDNQ